MDESDEDVYVSQLKELFASVDTKGAGRIGAAALTDLCSKLQLEGQVDLLLEHLLGNDTSKTVDFDTFKEAFVMVLSSTVDLDGVEVGTDIDQEYSMGSFQDSADLIEEVSPKFVKDGKRYGRRSRIDFDATADFSEVDDDLTSNEPKSLAEELGPMKSYHESTEQSDNRRTRSYADERVEVPDIDHDDQRRSHSHSHSHSASHKSNQPEPLRNETFEAEGQMNASMSVYEQGPSEAEQVQAIWEEVGVGKDGFLNINELAVVCEHIGMEDMDRTELGNLFIKLDRDEDGKVGFEEFLDGLFRTAGIRTPAPLTPLAPTPSLLSSQIAKRRMQGMSSAMDEPMYRTATPSILMAQPITKLFSVLDPNNAGFTTMDAASEQLMEQGIYNPQEVLEALDMYPDAGGRISLQDLSLALDNVLMTTGENNGVYQAALTSYQSELKHLRSLNDQLTAERDKFKMDITEANRQNSALVQEIDDRHANIEKTNENKLRDMERKYQDKINSLQAQIEKEREMISSQASNQTTKLLDEMDQLRGDDALSKERLQNLVEDNNNLEQDLNEAMEKLLEYEKTITKQQRDLDGFSELEERLADLETSKDGVSKQQEVFYEQRRRDMEEEKRIMQDQMDEMSQENELLKHQVSERKVRRKGSKIQGGPKRGGSVLSDYTDKPNVMKRNLNDSSDNDSELDELDPKSKRHLPNVTGIPEEEEEDELSGEIQKRLEEEKAKLEAKIESLKEQHLEEIEETKETFETEIKEIEKRYRQEMKEMENRFEQESEKMARELQEKEKESEEDKLSLAMQFEEEKGQLMEEFEGEKAALEQAFEIVKVELDETLKTEFAEELADRLAEQAARFDEERLSLEGALTDDKSKLVTDIQQVREDSESKLRNLKMELEVQHLEEKEEIESKFDEAREDLRLQLREKQNELDGILEYGEAGLKGQLKEDFIDLLDKHKQVTENDFLEKLEVEKEALSLQLQEERQGMQDEFDREKYELSDAVSGEKSDLLEHFQRETDEMIEKHQRERKEAEERFKADRNKMADKHRKEIDDLMRMNEETIDDLKKQHAKAIDKLQKEKSKLEEKLEKEKRKLEERMKTDKERWEEENAKLKRRHEQELQQAAEEAERERDMMEMAVRVEVQRNVEKEVTEEYEEKMDQVKTEFEDEKAEIIAENEMLQNKLRMAEVAKEEAVVAIQMQTQEAALQQARPDRASYDALSTERDLLKLSLSGLEEKLRMMTEKADSANQELHTFETKLMALATEKSHLQRELEDLNKKYINMQMQISVASSQHSREMERVRQAQALEFQGELGHLREELAQRDGRLAELNRQMKEKAEELKRALSIGKETEGSDVRKMRRGKEEAEKKYRKMRAMLEEYMKKLKDQLAKTTRHDVLLKELYVENSKLQRTLQLTEERQKTAERNCHNLVEKNQAYLNILKKVCPVAV
ncbi:ninein-like protein isoform X2 [Strongylocentrotus purpuratus]|uniref:EF-hand domain-containing protein n=1 Tax=Strongylocentrotus purpuratus TaxID=7668 RepID=A0A7M7PRW6_STRPU|nr:ninein-like protein isoform X2 [Strongylocentrotus purpuratus]XP_030855104.1 ninein-like protein isoform X2 [Strongylocentrotus purpuratus]